jgi:hypothetical protein
VSAGSPATHLDRAERRAAALYATGGYLALTLFWFRPVWGEIERAVSPAGGDPPEVPTPLRALFGGGVVAYDVLVLTSFVLCGALTFAVFHRRGLSTLAAFAAGLVFAAAPFRWDQLSHLAVLWTQWLPLLAFTWDDLLAAPTAHRASAFLGVYLVQMSAGPALVPLATLPLLVLLVVHARDRGRALLSRDALRVLVPTALGAACLVALVYVSAGRNLPASPEEIRAHGATLTSLTQPSMRNLYFSPHEWAGSWRAENALFAGFVAVTLVCVSLFVILRRSLERHQGPILPRWDRAMLGIAATSLLLCFAEAFLALARMVPGLDAVTPPTRFFAVALMAIAWLAGRGLDVVIGTRASLARPVATWRTVLVAALLAVLLVESTPRRLDRSPASAEAVYPPRG